MVVWRMRAAYLYPSATGNVFSYDPTKFLGFDRFETKHELYPLGRFPAPFDSYTFQAFAFAINPTSNQSVNIARFLVPGSPNGFAICSNDTEVVRRFTYNTGDGPATVEVKSRLLTAVIRYSTLALALTVCMVIVNWALTLASLYIAFLAMTKGRVTWSTFTLHGTMAMAIPSIRGLYLCPPPFGTFLGVV